mmetsp:Transcript_19665/g.16240  ORF Transcript_19665/g.16240 Transcript_19665/m.16240 type:complete len:113 (-) Transcript_19665:189-527(-)
MVDLPGFGFAKIATKVKARISDELGKYIADREALKLVVVLVDLRIEAQKTDMDALELLYSLDIPFLVVGTKADKLAKRLGAHSASMSLLGRSPRKLGVSWPWWTCQGSGSPR